MVLIAMEIIIDDENIKKQSNSNSHNFPQNPTMGEGANIPSLSTHHNPVVNRNE